MRRGNKRYMYKVEVNGLRLVTGERRVVHRFAPGDQRLINELSISWTTPDRAFGGTAFGKKTTAQKWAAAFKTFTKDVKIITEVSDVRDD